MRYYALLGVKFRVCGLAAADYGYRTEDFQDFIEVAPSAITELGHWQQQGYALITPRILEKRFRLEPRFPDKNPPPPGNGSGYHEYRSGCPRGCL